MLVVCKSNWLYQHEGIFGGRWIDVGLEFSRFYVWLSGWLPFCPGQASVLWVSPPMKQWFMGIFWGLIFVWMDLNKKYVKAFFYSLLPFCMFVCYIFYLFYNLSLFFQTHLFLLEGEVNSLRSCVQSAVQQHLVGYNHCSSRNYPLGI